MECEKIIFTRTAFAIDELEIAKAPDLHLMGNTSIANERGLGDWIERQGKAEENKGFCHFLRVCESIMEVKYVKEKNIFKNMLWLSGKNHHFLLKN